MGDRILGVATLHYRIRPPDDPSNLKPINRWQHRVATWAIVSVIIVPTLYEIGGGLFFYLAFALPDGFEWLTELLAYPGILFSKEGRPIFWINAGFWYIVGVLVIELFLWWLRGRLTRPARSPILR